MTYGINIVHGLQVSEVKKCYYCHEAVKKGEGTYYCHKLLHRKCMSLFKLNRFALMRGH